MSLEQGLIIGLVGVIFLLMWVALLVNSIHHEITAITKSLSPTSSQPKELKDNIDIGDTKNDIEDSL